MKSIKRINVMLLFSLLTVTSLLLSPGARLNALAAEFAGPGDKATLSVEYTFASAGKKADKYDSHEWHINRTVSLVAELAAEKPSPMPQLQAPDAEQMGTIERQQAQAGKMAEAMAPMMDRVAEIMAKCGDNEACIQQQTMQLGASMSGTKEVKETLKAGRETAQLMQPGELRYQAWKATALSGDYKIEETSSFVDADPICMSMPGARCHRNEKRVGSGAVPGASPDVVKQGDGAGPSSVEVDTGKHTLFVRLPVPLAPLPYTETITTDKPTQTGDNGTRQRQLSFATLRDLKPITIDFRDGWRSQSGEQVVASTSDGDQGGKLIARWRFEAK